MRTLVLDTSGAFTTVLVEADGAAAAHESRRVPALRLLHPMIREVLARLECGLSEIERIAVVLGPGSWTGLNIGVTAAKTLAQVLELPLVGLVSLDALVADVLGADTPAAGAPAAGAPVYAILDGKRSHVYCSAYSTDENGRPRLDGVEPALLAFDQLRRRVQGVDGRAIVVEYGEVYRARIEGDLPEVTYASRASLGAEGLIAALGARQGQPLDAAGIAGLAPLYLQPALGSP
ncbi:MAG: tRNA (adenosine(37)-N6)-threonylcarbamoyltransferase complex dimerization subunit type 1 TsaB [Holophagales bacterium]|nr:tRNA (adenosine(37)-N6)-threonylcarbamoyltransferase complex dimerization subunit type 1 TsaB [Holophagales bacterium]